jgi:ClpP class serine protease
MSRQWATLAAAMAVLLLLASRSTIMAAATPGADLLTLTDGTQYEGRLVERGDERVEFEIHIGSIRFMRVFAADQVADVQTATPAEPVAHVEGSAVADATAAALVDAASAPAGSAAPSAADGPTYLLLPLRGTFGEQIDGPTVAQCLAHAQAVRPDAVVVWINSPGGAMETLVDVAEGLGRFQRDSGIPVVAFVDHNALSAAALTAMSIASIYTTPDGTIGAALVIQFGPGGGATSVAADGDVAEKFLSVFRAKVRGWVQQAGHDPLLSEAMIDPSLELHVASAPHGRRVLRGPLDARVAAEGETQLLVAQGRLLTLTAEDARDVGLVNGIVTNLDELGAALGLAGWRPIDDQAQRLMTERAEFATQARANYERSARGLMTTLQQVIDGSVSHIGQQERAVTALRSRITRIERLVEEHPFLMPTAMADFPGGLTALKFRCDEILQQIRTARREYLRHRCGCGRCRRRPPAADGVTIRAQSRPMPTRHGPAL